MRGGAGGAIQHPSTPEKPGAVFIVRTFDMRAARTQITRDPALIAPCRALLISHVTAGEQTADIE